MQKFQTYSGQERFIMSSDDFQKGKRTPPKMAVIMTFLVALIVIFTALLINFSDPSNPWLTNFSTSASTVSPSPLSATSPEMVSEDLHTTSEETLSPTVQTIDQYFRYINLAKSSEDLGKAWEMMTIKSKCNPADRCNFVQFQDFWWNFRVEYKLY